MRRSVRRKRLKVIGLWLCLMMLGLWVFSAIFMASYVLPSSRWGIVFWRGRILFGDTQGELGPGWTCRSYYARWLLAPESPWTEFAHHQLGFGLPGFDQILHVPVWLFLTAVGFPTAILWWRDRRPKAGFCTVCKYDLTGNVSGTCPECGTSLAPEKAT